MIGAGPAGMTAAATARGCGLDVVVVDEQPSPGGQIWRSVETAARRGLQLGEAYTEGATAAEAFRASGARYLPDTQVWLIESGYRAFVSRDRQPQIIEADAIILATGAQERPVPFPGWTLPGVLTVGAAQILLKSSGQIPAGPMWIAGSGPLPLLYAVQLLEAGGNIEGFLDTTPSGQWRTALRHLPRNLHAWAGLLKGLGWLAALRHVSIVPAASGIKAHGKDRLESISYQTKNGVRMHTPTRTLLVHEGVVPSIHAALSLDCDVIWNTAQDCFAPVVDEWGESTRTNFFIAGDGAGIAGAKAAQLRGELAALRVAQKLGRTTEKASAASARRTRQKLADETAIRPFLDALYRPRPEIFAPPDETIVCRCEEVTAGEIRKLGRVGRPGPNQIKAATRAGMGPCQGRQCGYTVTRILAAAQNRTPGDVGFLHVRPPLKSVTLGDLASLMIPLRAVDESDRASADE